MAVKAAVRAPSGAQWESPWNPFYLEHFQPGTSETMVRFGTRRSVYEQFKANSASLRLTFAINQARAASTATIPLPLGEFTVPGFGICTPQTGWFKYPKEITGISCRTAMRYPRLTYVTAHWSEGPCTSGGGDERLMLGAAWASSFDTDPAGVRHYLGVGDAVESLQQLGRLQHGNNSGVAPVPRLTGNVYALRTDGPCANGNSDTQLSLAGARPGRHVSAAQRNVSNEESMSR